MKEFLLKNVELKWPYLAKKNEGSEYSSNKYQVDIVLTGDNLKVIEENKNKKQKIKENEGVKSITLKSAKKPHVYNSAKALMTDDELAKVGNGSVAHVKVTQYSTKFGDYLGLGPVKVIKVAEYSADADFGDDDDVAEDAPFEVDDEELI